MSIEIGNIWFQMTEEQKTFVKAQIKLLDKFWADKINRTDKSDPNYEVNVVRACGINQFCENLGIEGYEFT